MNRNIFKDVLPYRLGIIQSRASRNIIEFREKILHEHDLGSPEWFVLGYAASQTPDGGVKVGSIASLLDVHSTYVTGILRRLEAKDLISVRPDKHDRRARLVTATKKGFATAEAIDKEFVKQSNEWLSSVSGEAMKQYVQVLETLAQDSQTESK